MMRICDWTKCTEWAQWRAVYPDETIRRLCQVHKDQHQKEIARKDVKYYFMGAEPSGIDNSQR